ncbi:hypothetical protein RDV89_06340 [Nocardioides zeae]|uniref:ECF transporter S component n=1 Tax=Nocardioides imazamoxiresistens TaxID=3231893 RepID=A0ABU3PU01_9ACTN|nr:hypothetical protein [Nocardioides zeae]MDT9592676.1 hypothetical protein [Nocardioides zeae]
MSDPAAPGDDPAPATFDQIAADLQALRAAAGHPSYAEIVRLVGLQRDRTGGGPVRPGRTTVYEVFRPGRRRVDARLVGEIVRALGGTAEEAAGWEERCRRARAHVDAGVAAPPSEPPDAPPPAAEPIPAAEPTGPPALPEPSDGPAPAPRRGGRRTPSRTAVALLVLACVALNLLGRAVVDVAAVPLFLDMAGTAVAAVLLGPWWGVLVAVATNVGGTAISGWVSLPFVVVNVVGALLWGYGVRRFDAAASIQRFFVLTLVVAVACTAVASPIVLLVFDGEVGHGADVVIATIGETYDNLVASVLSANLLVSFADKLICGFVALVALEAARSRWSTTPAPPELRR